jgi:hypothetical protein
VLEVFIFCVEKKTVEFPNSALLFDVQEPLLSKSYPATAKGGPDGI